MFRVLIFSLISLNAMATSFDEFRANLNQNYESFLRGECKQLEERCLVQSSSQLSDFEKLSQSLSSNEDYFFSKASSDQVEALTCDIKQIALMSKDDAKGMSFQTQVLLDLKNKLPELRKRYVNIRKYESEISSIKKEMDAQHSSINRSLKTPEQAAPILSRLGNQLKAVETLFGPETATFNTIFSSLWRSDDPFMQEFVMRAVASPKSPDEIFKESFQDDAENGFLGYKLYTDNAEFSLKEQVLDRILAQSKSDLETLQSQGKNLSFSTKKMLVQSSEWASTLNRSAEDGNARNAALMCNLDQKYVSGDNSIITTMEIGSTLVGGVGVLGKVFSASKVVRLLGPAAEVGLLNTSRVLSVASILLGAPIAVTDVRDQCFGNRPQASYSGHKKCDAQNFQNFDQIEKQRNEDENCTLAVVLGGITLAGVPAELKAALSPEFLNAIKSYKKFGPVPRLDLAIIEGVKKEAAYLKLFLAKQLYPEQHADIAAAITALQKANPNMPKAEINRMIERKMNSCDL